MSGWVILGGVWITLAGLAAVAIARAVRIADNNMCDWNI